jgi:hypothetical protein
MKAPLRPSRQAAEMVAIQALGYLAAEPERLRRFLDITGIEAADIRAAARESRFLAGVLEHMLGDENLLVAFAADAGIDPAEVARARSALGGPRKRDSF